LHLIDDDWRRMIGKKGTRIHLGAFGQAWQVKAFVVISMGSSKVPTPSFSPSGDAKHLV